ncbi:helix-turn-helix domain-containing protein [Sphingobacterium sp. IITKGP-BTPF85]|uniref:helix-turn-helix domain-containing protein n=1 Tax=Sphingobacterium sp. IITKGP-BTPF85 TaxID=1338009 RepID=UPI00038A4A1C|nr:helix-turn-helix domain-containing protein [Sphingobacterium sp. IITKGP-BTPF85]KKX49786.1 hypothetical protein L950_0213885 [Sphingobacterium sp. IITKGP-BTPF85]
MKGKEMVYKSFANKHILGAYLFPCKDLESNQPLFNDGFPSLIFMPRSSDDVILKEKGKIIRLQSAWVCCGVIQDTQWEIPDGLEYIMVLRFNPASFYSIFDIDPLIFQSNPICGFRDIVDETWCSVIDEMYQKESIAEKVSFLDEVFSSCYIENNLPYFLQAAIEHIDEQRGNTTVSDLLKKLGGRINHKWLHRNFVKYLGISPKKYISLQRFIYAYGHCGPEDSADLFDVALNSGYYDYNHFFKDFKQYLGIAPSRYSWA